MTDTRIRIANAPCSWGALEFDLEGETPGYERVLQEMAQTGYVGTELGDWGFMPREPEALKAAVKRQGLEVMAAFVPVALRDPRAHEEGQAVALRTARLLSAVSDNAFIVLADDNGADPTRTSHAGRIQPSQGLDSDQWHVFAQGAERIARATLEHTGVRTVFHFHCGGFVETPEEVDALMERTDPELLGLCFDTGHYAYGGGDPVAGLRRHLDRVWHVHFKDCHGDIANRAREAGWDYFRAVREGVFCELGQGSVDFGGVTDLLREDDYEGWIVVEQDVLPGMGTPMESARRNRAHLAGLGL